MKVAVSFLATEFEKLKEHWKQNVNLDKSKTGTGKGLGGVKANEKGVEMSLGGAFCIIDLNTKEIVKQISLDAPAGFVIQDNTLNILNMRLHEFYKVDLVSGEILSTITNKAFNCLHSLELTNNGFLISSTGTDSIYELKSNGDLIFDWWATDQGFSTTPNGEQRVLDKSLEHNEYVYPTLYQTTHVNSAYPESDTTILATLFHQGQLVRINKETKEVTVLLDGLNCPHRVNKYNDGWTLSDTKNNQVLILNESFEIITKIKSDFNWVQDSFAMDNLLYIADSNNNRIVIYDISKDKVVDEYRFSKDWRIYQIQGFN